MPEPYNDNSETELYILGMDLFTILGFFWLAMLLVNPSVIPVAAQHNQNGNGVPGEALTLYLSEDGASVRVASPQAKALALNQAGPAITRLIMMQKPQQVVLAAPSALPTGQTNHVLDQLMGWLEHADTPTTAIRLLVTQGDKSP